MNKPKSKLDDLFINPYYDAVLGSGHIVVPSKTMGFKKNELGEIELKPPTKSVKEFQDWMKSDHLKEHLDNNDFYEWNWPLKGNLFMYIILGFTQKDFKTKDVDNTIKPLIDSMKEIVFDDDVQITQLAVTKNLSPNEPYFIIGIKRLNKDDKPMFDEFPNPLYEDTYIAKNPPISVDWWPT